MMAMRIRVLLVLAALINLVFWIFIAPGLFDTAKTAGTPTESGSSQQTEVLPADVYITFSADAVRYDGNGMLPVMDGVSVRDSSGGDMTDRVTVSVAPAAVSPTPLTERKLTYAVTRSDGTTVTAARTLYLENYTMPSITFTGAGETLEAAEYADAVPAMIARGYLSADDGFGHDISAAVEMVCDTEITGEGMYTFTLSVENLLGDTAQLHTALYVRGTAGGVTLRLKASAVTLGVGEVFRAQDYIAAAHDPADGDLTDYVRTEGSVNTAVPGVYSVTYSVANLRGEEAVPQTLTVTVVE